MMRSIKRSLGICIALFLAIIVISGCRAMDDSTGSISSWAYSFVVWNNHTYSITNETLTREEIDHDIGQVKHYSDKEGSYRDGFSNKYPVGTKLYKIKDVETTEYIAVEIQEDQFIKATNENLSGDK
ncbi:hypothetical protein J2W91_002107 [Paenibacillus amylolyticus]|uniref:Uncharacterized protein n=2 Tax=Paenibacillus amylolyticus TaxID=1451 RepID=A0AAP5H010_PAEAM|nr:hypothetical protein [Paenibacillus amylolyticus]